MDPHVDGFVRTLIAIIGNDAARFQIDPGPQHRITDKIEVSEFAAGKHERRFELGTGADDAVFIQPTPATQVSTGGNETARANDQRPLEDRTYFDLRRAVDGNIARNLVMLIRQLP